MRRKKTLLLSFAGVAAMAAMLASASSHADRDWDAAVQAYRAASDANATVALTVIADLSRGVPPATLLPRLAVGVERGHEAYRALADAAPSPLLGQGDGNRRFLSAAGKETAAMDGLEEALRRLSTLEPQAWDAAIGEVHAQGAAFAEAREVTGATE